MSATTCPLCGDPVARYRTYCSRVCAGRARNAAIRGSVCQAPGCAEPAATLCALHYRRKRKNGTFGLVNPWAGKTDQERFEAKFHREGADECWQWTGEIGTTGYGVFRTYPDGFRKRHYAHRWALRASGVELRDDQVVLHLCDNPPCVNPAHLRAGTQADNIHDALAKGRLNMSGLLIGQRMSTRTSRQKREAAA